MGRPLAAFLVPDGFSVPPVGAVLSEARVAAEAGRLAAHRLQQRRGRRAAAYTERVVDRSADPVVLVPGFLAGDPTLAFLAAALRDRGHRTYRSQIRANIGCTQAATAQLERRVEWVAGRRDTRVRLVGHSLGGMLARGLAVRRPDLVSGVVTLGSPTLAPGAHHVLLSHGVEALVRLSRAGLPGLMAEDCVAGECARTSWEQSREPVAPDVTLTSIYSRRDGIVDWRACIDPLGEAVEVAASHIGLVLDPRSIDAVLTALRAAPAAAAPPGPALTA